MTTSDLLSEINSSITTNGSNQITGAILRGVLTDMVNTLGANVANSFSYPNDSTTPVTTADIGKLAMNDGSGRAKVYSLSAAVDSVPGSWTVNFTSGTWSGLSSNSAINITQLSGDTTHIDQVAWRNGQTPASPLAELTLLKAAIDSYSLGVTVTLTDSNTMTISEGSTYQGLVIGVANMPEGSFSVEQLSLPECPISPTAFPLGKVIGIQDNNVIISSAAIEVYSFDGTYTLPNQNFNTATYKDINFDDPTGSEVMGFVNMVAVPASSGKVTYFDPTIYNLDSSIPYSFRHQILGLILAVNSANSTVTVLHLNALSPILNFALKAIWAGNVNS